MKGIAKEKGDVKKMRRGIALLLVSVVVLTITVVVVSGCGGVSQQEAEEQFKGDLQNFETSLLGLVNPGNFTSVDSFNTAFKDVEKAYNDLVKSAKQVKDTNITALKNAWNGLTKAVGNVSSSQSLLQKMDAITKALQELETTVQRLLSTFNPSQ